MSKVQIKLSINLVFSFMLVFPIISGHLSRFGTFLSEIGGGLLPGSMITISIGTAIGIYAFLSAYTFVNSVFRSKDVQTVLDSK